MEIDNILAELDRLMKLIAELEGILADETKIFAIIKEEMLEIKRKYGDERRTVIEEAEDDIILEDLIERHKCLITTTHDGYIKRISVDTYEAQNRGGKGINAMKTKEEDSVKDMFVSHSHNYLFMFTSLGRLYIKKCYQIPEGSRTSKGTHISNILPLQENEKITAFISVAKINTDEVLVMTTEKGMIKRCPLSAFRHIRAKGVIAIKLREDDKLLFVNKTEGDSEIFVAASNGQALKFSEKRVRVMGRTSSGVRAIRLAEGEKVVGCLTIKPNENGEYSRSLLTLTENGFGKRCDFSLFAEKGRGGKGMRCHKLTEKTGALAGIAAVEETDDVMLMTDGGMLIRTVVSQISMSGRSASGVIVMRLADGSKIIGFERIKKEEEAEKEALPENDGEELDVLGDDVPEEEDVEEDEVDDEVDETDDEEDEEADDETEE